jgi:hypothetical protein
MAAATSALLSGTPVGTVSSISWVSDMVDPRTECSAVGASGPFGSGHRSITRISASAANASPERLGLGLQPGGRLTQA